MFFGVFVWFVVCRVLCEFWLCGGGGGGSLTKGKMEDDISINGISLA